MIIKSNNPIIRLKNQKGIMNKYMNADALTLQTQYPVIEDGKVIANSGRCLDKCSHKEPFEYQPTETSNASGNYSVNNTYVAKDPTADKITINWSRIGKELILVGVVLILYNIIIKNVKPSK